MDRETAQRQELESVASPIDKGEGYYVTPTRNANFSRRGRLVRLPEYSDAGTGAVHVSQFVQSSATKNDGVNPVNTTVFSYTVPSAYGLRVVELQCFPVDLGAYPWIETTWLISNDVVSGYYGLYDPNPYAVKFIVPAGKTITAMVTNAAPVDLAVNVSMRGYLFTESETC
jgi:hypothetical protein